MYGEGHSSEEPACQGAGGREHVPGELRVAGQENSAARQNQYDGESGVGIEIAAGGALPIEPEKRHQVTTDPTGQGQCANRRRQARIGGGKPKRTVQYDSESDRALGYFESGEGVS